MFRLSESSEDECSDPDSVLLPAKRHRSSFSFEDAGRRESHSSLEEPRVSDWGSERRESQSTEDSFPQSDEERPQTSGYGDNKAKKMMERMGYEAGKGLGKHAQGRVEPIELSKQRGRRGLGMVIKGLEAATMKWDSSLEVISVEETAAWISEEGHGAVSRRTLDAWMKEGAKKLTIDDETNFCDPDLLRNVINSKSVFDELEPEEMRKARTRSNPFETIRGGFFLNRAAMKMANMDRVFDFMFTDPVDEAGDKMVGPEDLLYFADVCAGPGGFSEYILWRKKWRSKGFGFTLKGEHDFRLADFFAGPCESFEPYYGKGGVDGDGNVFDPDNIAAFTEYVMTQTDGKGVHFMMADGGFSVGGQENIQEILSKQLYLCQFLVGLSIIQTGGHFVCKVFDLFTKFSVGLIYLMYKSFQRVCIHKPNTSRPANSERYLVCQWKRDDCEEIRNYMFRVNRLLWQMPKTSNKDIVEVVPLEVMNADDDFITYIHTSNNSLGERQVVNLVKIAAYCRDVNLHETHQAEMRRKCLAYWKVEDRARTAPPRTSAEAKCEELLKKTSSSFMNEEAGQLTLDNLELIFKSVYDWHCVVLGSSQQRNNCNFYLSLGRTRVYKLSGARWTKEEATFDLSADTLVYGEMVQELRGEGKSQRKINTLHIIDGYVLGGEDIRDKHLTVRLAECDRFARAVNKPSRTDVTPIRVKTCYEMADIANVFDSLQLRVIKGAGGTKRLVYNLGLADERFYLPGGLLFVKATQDPWLRCLSRKTNYKYYYNPLKKESKYDKDRPPEANSSFVSGFRHRQVWWWCEGVKIHELHEEGDACKLQRDAFMAFIDYKTSL